MELDIPASCDAMPAGIVLTEEGALERVTMEHVMLKLLVQAFLSTI